MAAGLGFKTFTTGEVLNATDVNGYLMQGVLVFANTAARDAAITSPQEGQFAYTKDTNGLWYYDGAAWVASGATGDIEGVTAGVGISGGGTSGTVTVTNSMATAITTSGDLIYGTGSGTFTRRGIGSTDQVLTVAGGVPTWATPASGTPTGTFTLLNSSGTSLSGSSTTVSGLSGYNTIKVVIVGASLNAAGEPKMIINADTGVKYNLSGQLLESSTTYAVTQIGVSSADVNSDDAIYFGYMNAASSILAGIVTISAANSTSGVKPIEAIIGITGSNANQRKQGGGVYTGTSVVSSIALTTGASWDAGKVYVYGGNL